MAGIRNKLILGILPTWWAVTLYRERSRRTVGHCRNCGYNLTGNTSGVCPECGTAVALKSKVTA